MNAHRKGWTDQPQAQSIYKWADNEQPAPSGWLRLASAIQRLEAATLLFVQCAGFAAILYHGSDMLARWWLG